MTEPIASQRPVERLFDRYAESHRHPVNKAIHWICVPLIVWSGLAALWAWSPLAVVVAIAGATVFYAWLSPALAIGMAALVAVMVSPLPLATSRQALLVIAAVVFVAAWIGQFVGHRIEGRKPSFVDDAKFLLVGPAWLLADVYRKLGIAY